MFSDFLKIKFISCFCKICYISFQFNVFLKASTDQSNQCSQLKPFDWRLMRLLLSCRRQLFKVDKRPLPVSHMVAVPIIQIWAPFFHLRANPQPFLSESSASQCGLMRLSIRDPARQLTVSGWWICMGASSCVCVSLTNLSLFWLMHLPQLKLQPRPDPRAALCSLIDWLLHWWPATRSAATRRKKHTVQGLPSSLRQPLRLHSYIYTSARPCQPPTPQP